MKQLSCLLLVLVMMMGAMALAEDDATVAAQLLEDVKGSLAGKKVALFGSYGWGDGQWMRDWEADAANNGVTLACESVICNEAPDDEANAALEALAKAIG